MTDLIQQFDEKMQQFNTLRENIGSTINIKRQFTQDLKEKLNGIGQRIQYLYGLIGNLKKNKDNFERQLNDNNTNMQNNTNEMNANNARIAALEKEKAEMQQEISNKINEKQTEVQEKQRLQSELEALQQQITQLETENQRLQTENKRLQTENQRLQEKVQAATQAIQTAIEDLTNLMNEVPNAQTQQEIEPILNSIMETIESSIAMINNNNTQGQAPAPPAQGQESQDGLIIRDYPERLRDDQVTKNNIPLVLKNLQEHKDVVSTEEKNKIQKAINDINAQQKTGKLQETKLKQFYNEAFQKGGKKTRKIRNKKMRKTRKIKKSKKHQKGGFIYNPNTKRKKLKSSKNATRSRSSTRKRTYSSKTSRQSSKSSKSSF
jgi:predicted nuclease with TOPRIM domain